MDPFLTSTSQLAQFVPRFSLPAPASTPRPSSMIIESSPSQFSAYSSNSNRFGSPSYSKRSSTIGIKLPPAPFVGSSGNFSSSNYVPPSPLNQRPSESFNFNSNYDVDMSYSTPLSKPAPIRILPSMSALQLSTPHSIIRKEEKIKLKPIVTQPISSPLTPNTSSDSNLSTSSSNFKSPSLSAQHLIAPLTPPLTPPTFGQLRELPSIQLIPSPPAPITFPTLSAKLLSNYKLHSLFSSQYTILEELGSGGFGFVVSAARNSDNKTVAVKFIFRDKVPNHGWVNSRHWGDAPGLMQREDGSRIVPMEAYVLRNVRHEGVVAYVDLFEDDTYFYLVSLVSRFSNYTDRLLGYGTSWITLAITRKG